MQAICDIFALNVGRLSFCQNPFRRKLILNKICRINKFDAFFCEFISDAADQRIGVSTWQIPKHFNHTQIGHRTRKYLNVLDLSRHYSFLNTVFLKERDHFAELTDADPSDIFSDIIYSRIGFLVNGDDRQRHACFTSALDDKERKFTVSGDETVVHK